MKMRCSQGSLDINKKALTLSYKEKADVTIFICNKKIILCSWLVTSIILLKFINPNGGGILDVDRGSMKLIPHPCALNP